MTNEEYSYEVTPWRNDQWFTSPWNFDGRVKDMWQFADDLVIHDVTLRDGEQQSRVAFNKDQKIAIFEKLAEVGIKRIEAGMPAVSRDDYEAIEGMLKLGLEPDIFAFARCMVSDAKLCADLGCKGVILEIPANELLIKYGYRWETQKAIDAAVEATQYAHERGLYVDLFLIDFSRANYDYATKFIDAVNRDGYFDAVTCVDTQGTLHPLGAYYMIRTMKERYPDKKVEFHGHDDFGIGSANTIMAAAAGANAIHTSVAAIGERAGNVSYEDVVMTLKCMFDKDLGIDISKLCETADFVLDLAHSHCRPNRGIIGPVISEMEAGLPIGWFERLKHIDPLILFPYRFPMTGHKDITYTIGKGSGAPTIRYYLNEMGLPVDNDDFVKELNAAVKTQSMMMTHSLSVPQFQKLARKIYAKYENN